MKREMRIEEQEANMNVKFEGEITQLQPIGDSEIRYKRGVSKDKASILQRKFKQKSIEYNN